MSKFLTFCFYLLFFLTPLIFTPLNYELFEYNKMIFVYLLTVITTGVWILRMLKEKRLILRATPLDIPLLLFLLSQILSTVFSMDVHTSIWGYYSRSNGGLLSIISYVLLYYCFVSNFSPKSVLKFLKAAILGGLFVALWAIPEHFGASPSCLFLTGAFNDSCWVQDVQARVFASLGQPNWLAAFMEMLIFPTLYFALIEKNRNRSILYSVFAILFYAAFTFTYSRGATLGIGAGFVVFLAGLYWILRYKDTKIPREEAALSPNILIFIILISFILVNIIFGSAVTRFQLVNPSLPSASQAASSGSVSQLDTEGGTESGQIRLIVWKGALDIFKHYPIFGSGVETFAYSYYQYRPVEHNLVSEWDFLYNKAHNEYLNYLATTGIVGFGTYMLLIVTFLMWSLRQLLNKKLSYDYRLLTLAIVCAYIAYLIQNIFQFSVVIIALFFYLFPAVIFSYDDPEMWPFPRIDLRIRAVRNFFEVAFFRHNFIKNLLMVFVVLLIIFFSFGVIRLWIADTYYAKGYQYEQNDNVGQAYNDLVTASQLNSGEPLYRSELSYAAASSAVALSSQDATESATLKELADLEIAKVLHDSPNNVSFWRTAIRTYFALSTIDPSYNQKTLQALDKSISLAPTDPKLPYNKALVLEEMNQNDQALQAFQQSLQLKPNYHEALISLSDFYRAEGQNDKAKDVLNSTLKYFPDDPEALQKLNQIASASAQTK